MTSQKDTWSKEMRRVLSKLRKRAEKYTPKEIDEIVDEAVKAVRSEEKRGIKNTSDRVQGC